MKKLVAAALTAVTAVIAGSAIALTTIHAQEIPPGEDAPESTVPPPSGGTNLVVFVIPAGLGEVTDAACSLNGVAEESRAKPAMRVGHRFGGHSTDAWSAAGTRPGSQQASQAEGDVGLPDEACNTLRGLFVSLGGQAPQFEATELGPEDTEADEDEAAQTDDAQSEDDDASDDEDAGTLAPATGSTAIFVTIFAGGDAGTDGCTLGELVGMSGASVPVVEAGGEEPLQGAADIADVALPADACALLSALFSTLANPPSDDDASVPEDDDAPETDDDATPPSGGAAADDDEAEADDEDSTPQATATPRATGTPSATSTPSGTSTPSATGTPSSTSTPDPSDDEEDEEPLGDEEPEEAAP